MTTILPNTDRRPMAGLHRTRYGTWVAQWRDLDGPREIRRSRALRMASTPEEAAAHRDALFAELRAAGAVTSHTDERRASRLAAVRPDDTTRYICHVNRYDVNVAGVKLGSFPTLEEAMAARNSHLGIGGAA